MWIIPPEEVLQVQGVRHRDRVAAAEAHRTVSEARARNQQVAGASTLGDSRGSRTGIRGA